MKLFGYGILAGFFALFFGLVGVGGALVLFAPEHVPAPAISRLVHLDEKLRFIRENPEIKPRVLAVGSSVTWRQLDGSAFDPVLGGSKQFLNGGTGYLQIHQTREMARFYLDNYPQVKVLLVMISLPDFRNCTTEPTDMLAARDAVRYAFEGWPAAYFYFRYVSPQRYVRTAMTLPKRKKPGGGDLHLDAYGGGTLEVSPERIRGLRYGKIDPDAACVAALDRLIADAGERGLDLLLVFPPVHPEYRALYPDGIAWLADLARRMAGRAGRETPYMAVIDMIRDKGFRDSDFFDAFHLQDRSATVLSGRIARSLDGKLISSLPETGTLPRAHRTLRRARVSEPSGDMPKPAPSAARLITGPRPPEG